MKTWKELESRTKRISGVITTSIVGLLVAVMFIGFTTPAVPEGTEGLLIDFGTDISGFGEYEPAIAESSASSVSQPLEQESITQDIEESVVIPDKKVITKPKADIKKTPTETTKPVNKDELFDPNKIKNKGDKGSTSDGDKGGTGNQGDPNGIPDGGNGLGTKGDGYDVSGLGDRKIKSPPKLSVNHNEIGDVKIKITVDRNGKVIKADYERSGSTITDTYLIAQSKAAAMKTTFTVDNNATETQIGYITFHFKLQ